MCGVKTLSQGYRYQAECSFGAVAGTENNAGGAGSNAERVILEVPSELSQNSVTSLSGSKSFFKGVVIDASKHV